jgi:hypothetical protein
MSYRVPLGIVLLIVGLWWSLPGRKPEPTPAPPAPGEFSLRGKFTGPSAADDAAVLSALCGELASIIEWDGMLEEPRLKSGVAFDELRVAAREARCRGESIGQRQPLVRDAIQHYLDAAVGTSGGPITPEGRAKWIAAYRHLGRVCGDAAK